MDERRFKILLTKDISEKAMSILQAVGEVKRASANDEETLVRECKDAHAIIIDSLGQENAEAGRAQKTKSAVITKKILDSAPLLKVIGHAAAPLPKGRVENVPLREAARRGISVVYVPQTYPYAIADYTIGLMIAIARKLPALNHETKVNGKYRLSEDEYRGADVSFKTLGIIGFGRIGKLVALRAKAFEMRILVHDPYAIEEDVRELGAELTDMDTLLASSDYVTVHVAECPASHHMIGEREFGLMKPGAFFINTAWGKDIAKVRVVDEQALIAALTSGKLAGAAVDCFEHFPPEPGNPLLKMDNVIITPFWAYRVHSVIPDVCVAENVVKALKGQMPDHVANKF